LTRALAVALVIAVALAAVTVCLVFVFPGARSWRRQPGPTAPPARISSRVPVLAAEDAGRAAVCKPRFPDEERAGFGDRSLAQALGLPGDAWRFVEVWVVNRGPADLPALVVPPAAQAADGSRIVLTPLREALRAAGKAPTPAAELLLSHLAPDPSRPVGKGSFRSTVYAMPHSLRFRDLLSLEVDGMTLSPRETTVEALESFVERPRPDLIAALSAPAEGSSSRAAAPEESR
jgi:hypothetical protein